MVLAAVVVNPTPLAKAQPMKWMDSPRLRQRAKDTLEMCCWQALLPRTLTQLPEHCLFSSSHMNISASASTQVMRVFVHVFQSVNSIVHDNLLQIQIHNGTDLLRFSSNLWTPEVLLYRQSLWKLTPCLQCRAKFFH